MGNSSTIEQLVIALIAYDVIKFLIKVTANVIYRAVNYKEEPKKSFEERKEELKQKQ